MNEFPDDLSPEELLAWEMGQHGLALMRHMVHRVVRLGFYAAVAAAVAIVLVTALVMAF